MNRRDCMALGLGVAAFSGEGAAQTQPELPKVIDWPTLTTLEGKTIEPAQWQGQFSVLVFWATWCPFCKRHNAHLDKLYRETQGKPLRVLGVAVDGDEPLVHRYMQSNGYAFPVAIDTVGLRSRLTSRKSIPMTCIIDPRGRLTQAISGEMFEEDVLGFAKLATRPVS
ncbi:MAG: TlpA disulfide reductase family protein [Variovorax sp.]